MTGGFVSGQSVGIPGPKVTTITTTRVRNDVKTELTNLDTKSDAWGKIIPMGFGRHRVAGALVWASQFYKTTTSFDDVTTTKSEVHWRNIPLDPVNIYQPNGQIINIPRDIEDYDQNIPGGSQVTHGSEQNAYIDLCYSFGTEGDTRKTRYIEKVRINDLIVYDAASNPPYIKDGLGFSIRYGYDNAPPALLSKYPNGKFYYPGQTLICIDRFALADFGDNVPQSIDVEWGCCVGEPEDIAEAGWRLRFWLSEWGTQNLETPFKLAISPETLQPGGDIPLGLPSAWNVGPDILVYGTAIVTGDDPRFAADLNPVKILDGISTIQGAGNAPNGSVWKFSKIMTREAFIAYQQGGGIPQYTGNNYVRNDANSDAKGENYYEQNTVSYLFNAISSGKPNIYIADRIISITFDTKNTVSLTPFLGKGRTLYTTQLFRNKRGSLPFGVKLLNQNGTNLPSFWNGSFTNNRAAGSRNEWLGRGDGAQYYIGAPGEVYTYTPPEGDPTLAATVNSYVHVRNVYASE